MTNFSMIDFLFSECHVRQHWGREMAGDHRIARHTRLIWDEMERKGTHQLFVWDFDKFREQSMHWQIMENDNILYNQKWCEKYKSRRVTDDWGSLVHKLLEMALQYEEELKVELNQKYEPCILGDDDEF